MGRIILATVTLLTIPSLTLAALTSENFQIQGQSVGSPAPTAAYSTSTNFIATGESGPLYILPAPTVPSSPNTGGTIVKPVDDVSVLGKTDSVSLCHAVGNARYVVLYNAQVLVTLSQSDVDVSLKGHAGHNDDIIPPFLYNFGDGVMKFNGSNWTPNNEEIYANNCKDGNPVLPPQPVKPPAGTPTPTPEAPSGQQVVCGNSIRQGNPNRLVHVVTNPPCDVSSQSSVVVETSNTTVPSLSGINLPAGVPDFPKGAELFLAPVTVFVTDALGNQVDSFEGPVVIEISDPRILGLTSSDFVITQPTADELAWERLSFEVVGDTLRVTVNRPGELFIWFLPPTVEAATEEESEASTTPVALSIDTKTASNLIYVGIFFGILNVLLQLAKAPFTVTQFNRLLLEGWRNLIGLLTFKKRRQPWGTVYDSVTKAPVDPAYVRLYSDDDEKIAEAITDLDGRYGFVVPKGTYKMQVHKTNYTFPSRNKSLTGQDVIYQQLYYGGEFSTASAVAHDIPMDPVSFDWNQFEKLRTKQTNYFHKLDPFVMSFIDAMFYIGLLFLIWQMLAAPSIHSAVLLALYGMLLVFRFLGDKPPLYGSISDSDGPLQFALVHIIRGERIVYSKVTDAYGRYVAIVAPDTYTVRYQKRVTEDEYVTVCERQIKAKKGVINPRIKI